MSKVEELRIKYNTIPTTTFNRFAEADRTPTKKYLEFYLKTWQNKLNNNCPTTIAGLMVLVAQFDILLPYIVNKDIYHADYSDISLLKVVIARAEEVKEEKTFIKEQHVRVLEETDEYILLQPLTHRGSLKYGSGTKWCTASRNDSAVFNRYNKGGLLVYLIDKKGDKEDNVKKVAFYSDYNESPFSGYFQVYNVTDMIISDRKLISGGWKEEDFFKFSMIFRNYFNASKKMKESKDYVEKVTSLLSNLDLGLLTKHVKILEQNAKVDYISTLQTKITELLTNLNNPEYAKLTTKS